MKTAKIVFTLLLINVFFALPHKAMAQASDVLTVYGEECSGVNAVWEFSFAHSATETPKVSVTQFVLSIDTTNASGFPDVRFGTNDVNAPASNKDWNTGGDITQDNIFWCADQNQSAFIRPGQKDSFFEFQLVPNPNNPNANIFGYPITINWVANFASENGQGDPCANVQFISSGSFVVEDFPWTGNCLDTVTATSSTPGCDPLFNFTVHNKNSTQIPIDTVVFYTNEFAGTIRPSDIQAPQGWAIGSVTQGSVAFGANSGSYINYGQSLSGFIVGLRADPAATSFYFPWAATSQGTILDEDTVWNVPATVQQCSEDGSLDTVYISNNSKCIFDANLENFHSGSGADTVSPITAFIISTPTAGITLINPVLPNFTQYPWAKGWTDSGAGTNKITFFIPSKPLLYGQPGGINAPWGFSLDNNALDSPVVIINWQSLDSGKVISSGTDTIHCAHLGSPDKAVVTVLNGCEYMLVLTNTHTPASSLEGLVLQMPPAIGLFQSGNRAPAGWTWGSPTSPNGFPCQTRNSSDFLAPGASDTFFFTTSPNTPDATWPLTLFTFKAGTNDQLTDSTFNVQGCTPVPVLVCDTVTETIDSVNCGAVFTVNNRRTNAIDRVVVMPAFSSGRFINPAIPIPTSPWHDTVAQNGDSVVFVGSSIEPNGAPVSFDVSFNSGKPHQKFPVVIRTYSNGVECTTIDTMECEGTASVGPTSAQRPDLALTVAPNPLNNRSDIGFTLGSFSSVDLVLVDILGRTQSTLFSGTLSSGDHTLPLDASTLAPGTYYVRLEAEGQRVTKKIVVEH